MTNNGLRASPCPTSAPCPAPAWSAGLHGLRRRLRGLQAASGSAVLEGEHRGQQPRNPAQPVLNITAITSSAGRCRGLTWQADPGLLAALCTQARSAGRTGGQETGEFYFSRVLIVAIEARKPDQIDLGALLSLYFVFILPRGGQNVSKSHRYYAHSTRSAGEPSPDVIPNPTRGYSAMALAIASSSPLLFSSTSE